MNFEKIAMFYSIQNNRRLGKLKQTSKMKKLRSLKKLCA